MIKSEWAEITHEDVLKAIRIFDSERPEHPEPRNTFLIFEGKKYPAKYIRGMAYRVHFGHEISKEYNGGQETVNFFEKIGFETQYTHQNKNTHPNQKTASKNAQKAVTTSNCPVTESTSTKKKGYASSQNTEISISTRGVIEQKNALQLHLNRLLNGDVVCEKTFPWMKTPMVCTGVYERLYNALRTYRGNTGFNKGNVSLRCDFVCESRKLIIEYDERQHFSEARRIALLSYPQKISLNYDKDLWIRACKAVQAKDNQPVNRDETRAYYDSTRDIEAAKHGYRLIRIMHGQVDFTSKEAERVLAEWIGIKTENILPHISAPSKSVIANTIHQKSVKIGLYLQNAAIQGDATAFERAMDVVRVSDIDILVFPEFAYFPFVEKYQQSNILSDYDVQVLCQKTIELSRNIGKAVVICNKDLHGAIMSIYANARASNEETVCKSYIKHTMTDFSACDMDNYQAIAEKMFQPILYRGHRIALSICYDCNHSIFSRKSGKNGVDIILNSTGGDIVYDKWFKYNKVRAIENNCFVFVTMGGKGTEPKKVNCVYGFTPTGKEMKPGLLNGIDSGKRNIPGGIYVYDTAEYDGRTERDSSVNQKETVSKYIDLSISVDKIEDMIGQSIALTDKIWIYKAKEFNLVLCFVESNNIMKPEIVLKLLYADILKRIPNKRYLIINHWEAVDMKFYESTLSVVLKVRAMENYCAVVLMSEKLKKCFQCGQNRTAQVVKLVNGEFGMDLSRMGGPETIWRNKKEGMKAHWRNNVEWLISTM